MWNLTFRVKTSLHPASHARSKWRTVYVCMVLLWLHQNVQAVEYNIGSATLNVTYVDPQTGQAKGDRGEGKFAVSGKMSPESGLLVHVSSNGIAMKDPTGFGIKPSSSSSTYPPNHQGCEAPDNAPADHQPWIALIQRGGCKFKDKIHNAAVLKNASAVVIYNHRDEKELIHMDMSQDVNHIVSVFVHNDFGERIASLVDSGIRVKMNIAVEDIKIYDVQPATTIIRPRNPTVLGISVTFICILVLGLAGILGFVIYRNKILQRRRSRPRVVFASRDIIIQASQNLLDSDSPEVPPAHTEGC